MWAPSSPQHREGPRTNVAKSFFSPDLFESKHLDCVHWCSSCSNRSPSDSNFSLTIQCNTINTRSPDDILHMETEDLLLTRISLRFPQRPPRWHITHSLQWRHPPILDRSFV